MSCPISVILFGLALVVIALVSLPTIRMFKLYCKRIAEFEGRIEEYRSISKDDGGLSRFERENLAKLMSRYYLKFEDEELTAVGNKLRSLLIVGYGAAILFVAMSVYIGKILCR